MHSIQALLKVGQNPFLIYFNHFSKNPSKFFKFSGNLKLLWIHGILLIKPIYVKSLRSRNIPHNIRWQFKEHASPFNPGTWWCRLCTLEKYYILFEPEEASLNQRSEFFQHCYHQEPQLLVKKWYAFLQIFQLQLFFHKLNNFISFSF